MCNFKFYKTTKINNIIYLKDDICKEAIFKNGFCKYHPKGILQRQELYSDFKQWFDQNQDLKKMDDNNELSDSFMKFMYNSFISIVLRLRIIREIFNLSENTIVISNEKFLETYKNFLNIELAQGIIKINIHLIMTEYYEILKITPKSLLKLKGHNLYFKIND